MMFVVLVVGCTKEKEEMNSDCPEITIADTALNEPIWNHTITQLEIVDHCIEIQLVGYESCDEDEMHIVTNGGLTKSYPPQLSFSFKYDIPTDCLQHFERTYSFDLSKVDDILGNEESVILTFMKSDQSILYIK